MEKGLVHTKRQFGTKLVSCDAISKKERRNSDQLENLTGLQMQFLLKKQFFQKKHIFKELKTFFKK